MTQSIDEARTEWRQWRQFLAVAQPTPLHLMDVLAEPLVIFLRRIAPVLFDAIFGSYHAAGQSPQVVQEAIHKQIIVKLVAAGLGVAWAPESVRQIQRSGVSYCGVEAPAGLVLPGCETSLVRPAGPPNPALERFRAFLRKPARP